ncbi:uncharacterized membrane protein YhaH (DUF805 family) [Sphingomonas sp. PP-F2F-G114-C0414]|uniref:DUF805 domain-containing protein n=1 Tax=Sphingomonas sp. PP-F2F-G114-C0414 TaxID=2135662 RepID=UPI000EF8D089|nr:DUF805 domain-containing protein [Sphingomonas sp. PP-F2F-G114-C0414]RMB28706.1 uncharacterized membrane protein YhaH (DUF805 family) [Sphingomonas sp. PP-F2F-G114-C0414]
MILVRLFSYRARTAPLRWLAWLTLTLGFGWLSIETLARVEGVVLMSVFAALGLFAAKIGTETVRRVHDGGQSGWWVPTVATGVVALVLTAVARWLGHDADAIVWGTLTLAGIATAALGLRPGERGINDHGAPPTPWTSSGPADGRAGLMVAALLLAAGIAAGGAVITWQNALVRERDARMHAAEPRVPDTSAIQATGNEVSMNHEREASGNDNTALSTQIDSLLNEGHAR